METIRVVEDCLADQGATVFYEGIAMHEDHWTKRIDVKGGTIFNPFPNDKISDTAKLKEFADHNFKCDENRRKFSIRVENTMGKGEIARYEQFLLFPQCFQKTCTADT